MLFVFTPLLLAFAKFNANIFFLMGFPSGVWLEFCQVQLVMH